MAIVVGNERVAEIDPLEGVNFMKDFTNLFARLGKVRCATAKREKAQGHENEQKRTLSDEICPCYSNDAR